MDVHLYFEFWNSGVHTFVARIISREGNNVTIAAKWVNNIHLLRFEVTNSRGELRQSGQMNSCRFSWDWSTFISIGRQLAANWALKLDNKAVYFPRRSFIVHPELLIPFVWPRLERAMDISGSSSTKVSMLLRCEEKRSSSNFARTVCIWHRTLSVFGIFRWTRKPTSSAGSSL